MYVTRVVDMDTEAERTQYLAYDHLGFFWTEMPEWAEVFNEADATMYAEQFKGDVCSS